MNNLSAKIYNPNLGLLLIRIALASVFIYHGLGKLEHMSDTLGFFSMVHIPAFFAYLVPIVEFLGGVLLLLGVFVEIASVLLAIVMLVAITLVKFSNGFAGMPGRPGYELDLVLLLVLLGMACLGAGKYAVRKFWKSDEVSMN